MPLFSIETYSELQPHNKQEWLLTNGIGGFAMSTVVGMNTRRYHALLCAATNPPVGRVITINRIGEMLTLDNKPELYELGVNQFRGSIHPRGDRYLKKFELDETATWQYQVEDVSITKEVKLMWGQNVTAIRYTINPNGRPFKLMLEPFATLRDFHSLRSADGCNFQQQNADQSVTLSDGHNQFTIASDAGKFAPQPNWWYAQVYPCDTERGQQDQEDLFTPGNFILEGNKPSTITLWISLDHKTPGAWEGSTPRPPRMTGSPTIQKLSRAAADFIVARKAPDGRPGTSVIAGYPWFGDWGRDTMISLPGLLLVTGQFKQAREVLIVFAEYVSQGMIPNLFGDYSNQPEYNTVDASLWFIHAVFEYLRLSKDNETFQKILKPACQQIIEGYSKGTRYHIHMDPSDNLIFQGDPNTQLTWMDARCGDISFTPRQGKPVEINALWYHALVLMDMKDLAAKVAINFQKAFWLGPDQGLADVLDGTRKDSAIRPNQIFAVSLPSSPLTPDQQKAVVAIVQKQLLTPVGLRTLDRNNPGYRPIYTGDQFHRDGAYHNGTVWPWLLGAFLDAYLKVNNRSNESIQQAQTWLTPLINHMNDEGAIGQIAEIFDGDEPHRPVGCPAQAWSIAEVLRLAVSLNM